MLEEFVVARGLANLEFVEEVGDGWIFKRKRFLSLMDQIGRREIKTLILAHRDCLIRFGFEWFEHYATTHSCEMLVLNQKRLSPRQEMTKDLMTIVHGCSSRLYGLRNYRKKRDDALQQGPEHELSSINRIRIRIAMQLSHKIALCPTPEQVEYFNRACGTARRVWNWALGEWNRRYAAGLKPNAMALKKQFNAIKYSDEHWLDEKGQPWLKCIHRDAHSQPFAYLAKAWSRFFSDIKAGKKAHEPQLKKKGRCRDSFYVANDKFALDGQTIRLPKIGQVAMTETLRFDGRILGAAVSRIADRWFVAIQVEVPDAQFHRPRSGHEINGIDLGIKAAVTLSSGESVEAPKPLKAALRRLRIRGRRVSRKIEAAKLSAGFAPHVRLPKGAKLPVSNNRRKSSATLARLHARIANVRADFTHKLTTRLCRENQVVVLEDLHVKGMLANDRLARAISDVGFGMFRSQLEYKAKRYGTRLLLADRWYPSSRLCSACNGKNDALTLKDREWTCLCCGTVHDRDYNAALNLKRLATETALPVASPSGNGGAASGRVPGVAGKVTPVRYECGQQDTSGQEMKRVHICAHF